MLLEVQKIKKTFLIFSLLLIFSFSFSIVAKENSTGENIILDTDQDGLSDKDEITYKTLPDNPDTDKDGYSDGAEVKSGYDPLKPAPGDKLAATTNIDPALSNKIATITTASTSGNLTEELSNKIATMVSSDTSDKGISVDSINSLIEESTASHASISDLPAIDETTIKVLKQNYSSFSEEKQARKKKEDNEEYFSAVFYIMSNNLPHSIGSKDDIQSFSNEIMQKIPAVVSETDATGLSYFTDLADKGAAMLSRLSEIEVPNDLLDTHKKGLQLATYAVSLKDKVKIDNNDPISSLVSFSEVENMMTLATDYLTEVESKLEELGLTEFIMSQDI